MFDLHHLGQPRLDHWCIRACLCWYVSCRSHRISSGRTCRQLVVLPMPPSVVSIWIKIRSFGEFYLFSTHHQLHDLSRSIFIMGKVRGRSQRQSSGSESSPLHGGKMVDWRNASMVHQVDWICKAFMLSSPMRIISPQYLPGHCR